MLSNIILGGITLPKPTTMPKLDFEPIILSSDPSVTGRLHNVYQIEMANPDYGNYETIRFNRKFSFEIIGLTKDQYDALDLIDGTNTTLKFERDTYTEEYQGNLDMTFFKFDEHLYFDAVNIEFVVTAQRQLDIVTLFFLGDFITPPVTVTDNLFFLGDETFIMMYSSTPSVIVGFPFFSIGAYGIGVINCWGLALYVGDYIEYDVYVNGEFLSHCVMDGITENDGSDGRASNFTTTDFTVNYLEHINYVVNVTKTSINGVISNDASDIFLNVVDVTYREYSTTDNGNIFFYIRSLPDSYTLYIRIQTGISGTDMTPIFGVRYDLYCDDEKLLSNIELLTGADSYYDADGEGTFSKVLEEGSTHTWKLKITERLISTGWALNDSHDYASSDMISPAPRNFKTRTNWK